MVSSYRFTDETALFLFRQNFIRFIKALAINYKTGSIM
jgi:hypothetical protein